MLPARKRVLKAFIILAKDTVVKGTFLKHRLTVVQNTHWVHCGNLQPCLQQTVYTYGSPIWLYAALHIHTTTVLAGVACPTAQLT